MPRYSDYLAYFGGRHHSHTEHTCTCGRVIRGNAFYRHTQSCGAHQARSREFLREMCDARAAGDMEGTHMAALKMVILEDRKD